MGQRPAEPGATHGLHQLLRRQGVAAAEVEFGEAGVVEVGEEGGEEVLGGGWGGGVGCLGCVHMSQRTRAGTEVKGKVWMTAKWRTGMDIGTMNRKFGGDFLFRSFGQTGSNSVQIGAPKGWCAGMAELDTGPHRSGDMVEDPGRTVQSVGPVRVPLFDGFMKRVNAVEEVPRPSGLRYLDCAHSPEGTDAGQGSKGDFADAIDLAHKSVHCEHQAPQSTHSIQCRQVRWILPNPPVAIANRRNSSTA